MKRIHTFILPLLLCLAVNTANAQWNLFTTLNSTLRDVIFISNDTGMASYSYNTSGSPTVPPVPEAYENVNYTTNAAATWPQVYYNSDYNPGGVVSYKMYAVKNTNTFYHINSYHQYLNITKTSNGGASWQNYAGGIVGFVDFSVPDTAHWFMARGNGSKYYINKYQNGIITNQIDSFTVQKPSLIFFPDATTGYIAASDAAYTNAHLILKSITGGTNWTTVFSDSSITIKKMYFTSANTGYVACASGKILKTSNGGTSWQYLTTGVTANLNSLYFINDSIGFAAGDNGLIIRTTDAGLTWTTDNTGTTDSFSKIFFVNDTVGFALAGTTLYKANRNALPSGINELAAAKKYQPLEIYPNPVQSTCTLKIPVALINENNVLLFVYNSAGQLVQKAVLNNKQKEVSIDFEKEAKGIYSIVLKSGTQNYSGKIIHE